MTPAVERSAVFHDPRLDCAFARDGFAVAPLFGPEQIEAIGAVFARFAGCYRGGFSATLLQPEADHRRVVGFRPRKRRCRAAVGDRGAGLSRSRVG